MTREEAIKVLKSEITEPGENIYYEAFNEAAYMAIESLSAETPTFQQKHQLSEETPTNAPTDLISRADAIGAVQDHFNADGFKGYDDGQKMMDRIKVLPSAKGGDAEIPSTEQYPYMKQSPNSGADLISRTDAIDAIKEDIRFYEKITEEQEEFDEGFVCGMHRAKSRIRELPSADRPNIAYICDGTACDGVCDECHHTTDIEHAKNFKCVDGKYIEEVDRPSGEWIPKPYEVDYRSDAECSACGRIVIDAYGYNYCPNCGAKMGSDTR